MPSSSFLHPSPFTTIFEGIMSALQHMKLNIIANTHAIQHLERRMDTIHTNQYLAMFPMYNEYCWIVL